MLNNFIYFSTKHDSMTAFFSRTEWKLTVKEIGVKA